MSQQVQQTSIGVSNVVKPSVYREGSLRSFRTSRRKVLLAAMLIADGSETLTAIAEQVGITPQALSSWRRKPNFLAVVREYRKRIDTEVMDSGIALKTVRMRKLGRYAERIEQVMDARAAAPENAPAPGGSSGLIVHDLKSIGSGPMAQVVDSFEADTALGKEYRDTLAQAAKEVGGQYEEKVPAGGTFNDNRSVVFNFPVLSAEDLAAVENAPTIDLPAARPRLLTRPSDGAQR